MYSQNWFWDVTNKISMSNSGIPKAETFGRNRKFSAFGLWFWPPEVKTEYGRNSRKALDFFFRSVFQDEVAQWLFGPRKISFHY